MSFKTIQIDHSKYGKLNCRIINCADGIETIWCQPLPENVHYDDPKDPIRYFYTVQSAIKSEVKTGIIGGVDHQSLRFENIQKYGCNQWPVCSLRAFLNTEFLEGLPDEIKNRIVPTENSICISRASAKSEEEDLHEDEMIENEAEQFFITSKLGGRIRSTYARVIDNIYIPLISFMKELGNTDENRLFIGSDGKLRYYWLMDPTPAMNDEFSVNFILQHYDEDKGRYMTYQNLANANSLNITAAPMFRIRR